MEVLKLGTAEKMRWDFTFEQWQHPKEVNRADTRRCIQNLQWDCRIVQTRSRIMDEKIKEQILYIKASGLTNMLDVTMVQRLANEYGFYELVIFLEENRADYVHFVLYEEA